MAEYQTHKFAGIGERLVTFKNAGAVVAADIGKAATLESDSDVDAGVADEVLAGKIRQVNGDDVSVQVKGYAEFDYTGTAPTAGAWNKLECAAAGKVQIDATNGHEFFVVSVDATAVTCVVDLG
jgi:hypothetical protein